MQFAGSHYAKNILHSLYKFSEELKPLQINLFSTYIELYHYKKNFPYSPQLLYTYR
jgi:hypothetical protein